MENYVVGQTIARGSFGCVKKARDVKNNRDVVFKIISIKNIEYNSLLIVQNELKLSKTLSHRNIVKYYDAFKNENFFVFVYEFCDQGTLKNMIEILKKETNKIIKEPNLTFVVNEDKLWRKVC